MINKSISKQLDSGLFRTLSDDLKSELTKNAILRCYPSDAIIYNVGDQSDGLYGVVAGSVRLTSMDPEGRLFIFGTMRPGWWFGETSTLDGAPRGQNAIAGEDCRVAKISRTVVMELLEREPRLYLHFIEIFCKRLRRAGLVIEETAFLNTKLRLANHLLRINEDRKKLPLKLTQEDLAAILGVTRQSIYRTIKQWQKNKWVSVEYGNIVILRPDCLASLTDECD